MLHPPLEMGHRFIRSSESLEGSGGLPADPSPGLSVWIARGGRNPKSVTRERLG